MPLKIVVVGAGVNGLSCAVCIQQCCPDAQVEIVADKFSPHTTSDGSGGYWEPYAMGDTNIDLIVKISKLTYEYLMELAYSPIAGEIGVQHLSGFSLVNEPMKEDPMFKDIVDGYRRLTPRELARYPMAKSGYFMTSIQLEVTPYLQWLMKRFKEKGGTTRTAKLSSLDELAGHCDLVVNCCGIGARELLKDDQIVPIRGQLWRVHAPWIKHFYIFKPSEGFDFSYIIPGVSNVVVGGTAQVGDWRTEHDDGDASSIWKAAQHYLPPMAKAIPIKSWTGLRPTRTTLRMEKEELNVDGKTLKVIHNYGHGGSGITIHWGCALEISKMVLEALGRKNVNISNPSFKSRI